MKTCLIIDDSPIIRKVSRRILEDRNFKVEETHDGEVALRMCGEAMPDIILLDSSMPVMSGIDFLLTLRREEGGLHPKIIFFTTESDMDHIMEAVHSGADGYLMKPFDRQSLEIKLQEFGFL
ncbi:MAG: response regulator [Alphaproteobacteria bacterium]|nr:response regulator [Alphaproteobacteria bacterium]